MLGWNLTDDFARNNCTVHTFWLAPSIYSLIFLYNILSLSGGGRRPFHLSRHPSHHPSSSSWKKKMMEEEEEEKLL
jgi:hypothetical protein